MKRALPFLLPTIALAATGDPQLGTDHPFYPGELHCSTFERLFASQAAQWQRITGSAPVTDQERALASWYWRNTHFAHGEEGAEDLWGTGFQTGDLRTRDYWTGLFAHGFGLCGTTHAQWTAEMQHLLGHGRARAVGVKAHNSFEVFLTGGAYGSGRWALLDHDISTIIFDPAGRSLLGIRDVAGDAKRLTDRAFSPEKQNGWLVCGLHPGDGGAFVEYNVAEYFAGYAGAPPMVHLRRGETLRRHFEPGLEDGKTFVFWGRNYRAGGIPGPERSRTWVNQPEKMHGSKNGTSHAPGQARYANAVYEYTPDFSSDDFREGVIAADDSHVVFEFHTPYIIAATPPDDSPWGIYKDGCRNGLILRGDAVCSVSISVDRGATWSKPVPFADGLDLTDLAKGRRQHWLKLADFSRPLTKSRITIRTVCQANPATFPRLRDSGTALSIEASGRAVISAGPNKPQAAAHIIAGAFGKPDVTLEFAAPRGEKAIAIHAAAHIASGNPPRSDVKYQIECSADRGASWQQVVKDWTIPRRGDEPRDFWSQSFCHGGTPLPVGAEPVRVRFSNSSGKAVLRAEAHLVYRVARQDGVSVKYAWTDDSGAHERSFTAPAGKPAHFQVPTGSNVRTRWVEMSPVW